jgi:hypothetical protein
MKSFKVCLKGNWCFDYLIEAISQAIKDMDLESVSIDLDYVN